MRRINGGPPVWRTEARTGWLGLAAAMAITGCPPVAPAQSVSLEAPYQVEGLEYASGQPAEGEIPPLVLVGLGSAADRWSNVTGEPMPADDTLASMTILGTRGFAHATRVSVERRCEYPCAYERSEACHWTGLYRLEAPLASIGEVVGALPGRLDLQGYVSLESSPMSNDASDGDPGRPSIATLAASGSPAELLWSGPWGDPPPMRLTVEKWDGESGRLDVTLIWGGEVSLVGEACESSVHEWLLAVDCEEFAVLASGGDPLLLSLSDYNRAKTEPLARFVYGGSRHYVVRYGAKAQDVTGLVSAEPAGWRARFRGRAWGQIC